MTKICEHLTSEESRIISEIRKADCCEILITKDMASGEVIMKTLRNSSIDLQAAAAMIKFKIGGQEIKLTFGYVLMVLNQVLTHITLPKDDSEESKKER